MSLKQEFCRFEPYLASQVCVIIGGMIKVYTTEVCAWCRQAKKLLDYLGAGYEEVDITNDPDTRKELFERYGAITVPVIVSERDFVVGYNTAKITAIAK